MNKKQRPVVSVVRGGSTTTSPSSSSSLTPGDIVLCRVARISQRAAFATIVCVEREQKASTSTSTTTKSTTTTKAIPLATPLTGIIRAPDVRLTEIDAVQVPSCFRPGDVVRARVLSLGDARSFYLTTAGDDLGVVFARSEASGAPLVPFVEGGGGARAQQQMRCPVTGTVEKRKVAIASGEHQQ